MVELISYRHSRHLLWPSLWHADPTLGLLVVPADVPEAADGHDPGGICGVLTGRRYRPADAPPDQPANSRHLHDRGYFDPVHSADSVRAGADNHPFSAQHPDGSEMLKLVDWAQAVVTFHGGASAHLDGVAWIYRVHRCSE